MNAHPSREEDFDLYALGALEGDERLTIESHVARCADCSRKLAQARGRVALLSLAAPDVEPSPAVKQRLMAQVRADAEAEARTNRAPGTPRTPESRKHAREIFARWLTAVKIPAFAVLAVITIFLWFHSRDLDRQLTDLRLSAQQQQQKLDEAREIADLAGASDTVTVALAQQPGQPQGAAHVMYNMKMGMLVYHGEIAPAPSAKSYELWLIPTDGKPINAGVFNPVLGRADQWMVKMPPGVEPRMFAVTLEPAGGRPQPTGPMVLSGHA